VNGALFVLVPTPYLSQVLVEGQVVEIEAEIDVVGGGWPQSHTTAHFPVQACILKNFTATDVDCTGARIAGDMAKA